MKNLLDTKTSARDAQNALILAKKNLKKAEEEYQASMKKNGEVNGLVEFVLKKLSASETGKKY